MVETKAQEFSHELPNLFVLCVCPHGSGGDSYGAERIKDISFFLDSVFFAHACNIWIDMLDKPFGVL
jgi:hypothetical protein